MYYIKKPETTNWFFIGIAGVLFLVFLAVIWSLNKPILLEKKRKEKYDEVLADEEDVKVSKKTKKRDKNIKKKKKLKKKDKRGSGDSRDDPQKDNTREESVETETSADSRTEDVDTTTDTTDSNTESGNTSDVEGYKDVELDNLQNKLERFNTEVGNFLWNSAEDGEKEKVANIYIKSFKGITPRIIFDKLRKLPPEIKGRINLNGTTLHEPIINMGSNPRLGKAIVDSGLTTYIGYMLATTQWVQLSANKSAEKYGKYIECLDRKVNFADYGVWVKVGNVNTSPIVECMRV